MKIILPFLTSRNETNMPGKGSCKFLKAVVQKTAVLVFCMILCTASIAQIALRGAQSATSNTTSVTVTKPAGLAVGDIMLANIVQSNNGNDVLSNATLSGWTLIAGEEFGNTGNNSWWGTILYKVVTAGDVAAANFTFTGDADANDIEAGIVAYSGVAVTGGVSGGPFDVTPGTINNINTDDFSAAAITTVTANTAVIMFGMIGDDRTISGWSTTSPGGLTELIDEDFNADLDMGMGIAWALKPTTGSTGVGVAELSVNANDFNGAILIALRPCTATPTITTATTPAPAATVCFSGSSQTTTLAYTATTNSPTAYSIDWNAAANTAGLTDQVSTAFAFAGGGGNVTGIVIPASVAAATYNGTMYITTAGGCINSKTITLTISAPTINIGGALSAICEGGTSAALGGTVGGSATGGTWSTPAGGTFNPDANTLNATWTPPGAYTGTATLTLTTSGGACGTTSAFKTQVVNAPPTTASAGSDETFCIGAFTLGANTASAGTGAWTIPSGPNTSTAQITGGLNNPAATFTPTAAGTYTLRWTISNSPCTASFDEVVYTVNALPQVTAFNGNSVCSGGIGQLTATLTGAGPFSVTYNPGGVNESSAVSGSPFNVTPNPGSPGTTNYTIISLEDANGCVRTTGFTDAAASIIVNTNGTWIGTTTDWFTPSNWCGGAIPTDATDVVIPAGGTQPTIGAPGAVCNNITINATATLTMNNTGTLSVNGNWSKAGTFTGNAGSTVTFDGAMQTISGNTTTFRNLTINSTTSTTISIATNISGVLSVPVGKTLNVGAVTLAINTGASATVDGTINNIGTITATGTLTFNAGGTYNHNLNGGAIPAATWNTVSNCNITAITNTVPTVASFEAVGGFGNLTWNCPAQTGDLSLAGSLTSVKGNFIVTNTNSGSLRLSNGGVTGETMNIGGNFSLSNGEFYISGTTSANSWTVNVNGDFTINGGTFFMSGSSGTATVNLKGDFTMSGGTLTESTSANTCAFNFNGTAVQTYTKTAGTISQVINFAINNGATVDFGTSVLNGTSPTFNLNSGGKIITANTNGISATGSIQVTGTKTFSSVANYEFQGANTGTFTTTPTANTVNNLIINRAAGVTLTNSIAVAGTLTLTSGNFTVGNNTLTLNGPYIAGTINNLVTTSGSSVAYNCTGSGPFTLPAFTAINNLTFNSGGQTYDLNTSPTVSGTLTLTNGLFSIGSNTLTLNGAVVRTNGTLAGSNTSNLTLAGTAGSLFFDQAGTNNVLKNFTLNTGATATLGNTLNITAYDGSSSEGVLTVTGTATLTTGGFLNIKSDANGTARIAPGRTTGGYISGNVSVERYIPQNNSKGWRLLASNTSGQTINAAWQEGGVGGMVNPNPGFGAKITAGGAITTSLATAQAAGFDTLSAGVSLFKYNATTDILENVTATNTGNIASEQGYFLFIRGNRSPGQYGAGAPATATILRSKGTLFLGNQTAVATGASNYGLVRNPYPSRIDMRSIVRGSNLIDAYQVWDSKLGGAFGVGGFQTFSKSGSDYVVSPGGGSYGSNGSVHNFIESGAAFFIQSISNTNNTAQVTEACKAASSSNESYRPSGVLSADKRLTFSLYAINPTSTDAVDGGLVFFNDSYSNNVDILDVRKSGNFSENFGIRRNNTDLVVERRKDVVSSDTIPFKMYQMRQISYRLDLENTGFDPAVTNVVLQDKYTGTNTTLDLSTVSSYTFTVSGVAASSATDRFRLVLASSGNIFSGTGNWTDNARWSKGVPPAPGDAVTIAADANATLNTDFTVAGSLTMTPTSTLVVNPTKTLSVSGSANLAGQSVTFKSDANGCGSLGAVTGTLSGATNVTVERYIPNNSFRSWRLLSVPTYGSGQTIRQAWQEGNANPLPLQNNLPNYGTQITGAFSTQAAATAAGFDDASANAGLLSWNGTGWSNVTSTSTAIANNKAYFMFVRGDRSKGVTGAVTNSSATTLRTNGTVYTGNQVFNVPTSSFSLVANTYPSAINFTGLTRSNVNNLFYIWDSKKQNGNSLGVYQTFSGTNSFNCLIAGGSYTLGQPNTIIESGQAFFVTGGSAAGGGTITLLEAAKVSGSNGNLGLRPAAMPAKINSRLYDANNEVIDANVVVFDAAYNKAVDADDAVKFGNPGANFAIETNSKILAVEGTQPVADKDVIQFRMWNLKQQDYKLEFVAGNMNTQDLYAVLEDNYLKTSKEVDLKGSTAIKFTVDAAAASSSANRFRIVFSKRKPVTGITVKPAYTIAPNPVENGSVNLLLKDQPAGKYNVKILGIAGQTITTKVISHPGGSSNQVIILPAKITAGNYQLEIIAPDNSKTSKQLLVSKVQ